MVDAISLIERAFPPIESSASNFTCILGQYDGFFLEELLEGYLILQVRPLIGEDPPCYIRLPLISSSRGKLQYSLYSDSESHQSKGRYSPHVRESDFTSLPSQSMQLVSSVLALAVRSTMILCYGYLNPVTSGVSFVHLNSGDCAWLKYPSLPFDGRIGFYLPDHTLIWLLLKFESQILQ